jgi:hypothetical protein
LSTKQEHDDKADHNEYLVSTLDNPFFDWQVTALFYAALHRVEAYFATKNIHLPTHTVRDSQIHRDHDLKSIYVDYRELEGESRAARYNPTVIFTKIDVQRLTTRLKTIKDYIANIK